MLSVEQLLAHLTFRGQAGKAAVVLGKEEQRQNLGKDFLVVGHQRREEQLQVPGIRVGGKLQRQQGKEGCRKKAGGLWKPGELRRRAGEHRRSRLVRGDLRRR